MRLSIRRIGALVAGAFLIASCDYGPSSSRFGNGISGGPTGTAPITPPAPGSVDSFPPFVRINVPVQTPTQLVNVGDSILVELELSDDREVAFATVTGFREIGDPDLGTFQRLQRYPTIRIPGGTAEFRAQLPDTVVRRYLKPASPLDTTLGPLVIEATVSDGQGNTWVAQRIVTMVQGPHLTIVDPLPGQQFPRGGNVTITVNAQHQTGVASMTVTAVNSQGTWPTALNFSSTVTFPAGTRDTSHGVTFQIPADAPTGGLMTVNVTGFDINGNPGAAAPIQLVVVPPGTQPPRVFQTVPDLLEIDDFITVNAQGDGITSVGYVLVDTLGVEFKRFTQAITPDPVTGFPSNVQRQLPLGLSLQEQGAVFEVYSFAVDNTAAPDGPLTGYSRPDVASAPVTVEAGAHRDEVTIAHGTTFRLPRDGIVGDIAVDNAGNVFVSNTQFNLLEVWQNPTQQFHAGGVRVGSLPWGLFLNEDQDTLYVANSGATTISRVFVGTTDPNSMQENLAQRIRTRENVIYQVSVAFDENQLIRITPVGSFAYSDRPQYIGISEAGRLFYSTRPTAAATPGTIRWLDPSLPFPDPQQIITYGTSNLGEGRVYTFFNADSVVVVKNLGTGVNMGSDVVRVYDHVYGTLGNTPATFLVYEDSMPPTVETVMRGLGGDVHVELNFNVSSLALTDTTFVAASADRRWLAFGEGNTGGTGRIMMIQDTAGMNSDSMFFSPAVSVSDLIQNASERVFGLALDSTGLQVAAHGLLTYMAAVDQPFHLRLEGVFDPFDNGAGVAFHPQANSTLSDPDHRVAFTATDGGIVEIVDVAHYNSRGRLTTRGNLYGPLRVTGPLPGDNAGLTCSTGSRATDDPDCIVLKLFGASAGGLKVINVQWKDIQP